MAAIDLGYTDMVNTRLGKLQVRHGTHACAALPFASSATPQSDSHCNNPPKQSRFPGSLHVKCLCACREEAEGRIDAAFKLYDEVCVLVCSVYMVLSVEELLRMLLRSVATGRKKRG